MTAMGRGLDKLLLGHGSADARWWQARARSTGQRKDAMVDPSTGQIAESLPPGPILTIPARSWSSDALACLVSRQQLAVSGAGVLGGFKVSSQQFLRWGEPIVGNRPGSPLVFSSRAF
jgi:hypothetical protein